MRVALVHDHLTQNGGAEQVLLSMMRAFPDAPVFTLVYDRNGMGEAFRDRTIHTSFLQRLPGGVRYFRSFLPLMPWATEHHDLAGYDVVISSSSAFAKGVITGPETTHICYCHTPTRYLWGDRVGYIRELPYPKMVRRAIAATLPSLRQWDRLAAERPDLMLANSHVVRGRIQKYYRRDSTVVYPPVEVNAFRMQHDAGEYYLAGGRLVTYKRFDMVVQAFNRLKLPLIIFGDGPDYRRLAAVARPNIRMMGRVSTPELVSLFENCRAFIHPQEEDFGITAVEAMAAGRPVIAFARGGATETVVADETGIFFDEQSWEALADTVIRSQVRQFDPAIIRARAEQFSSDVFNDRLRDIVTTAYEGRR